MSNPLQDRVRRELLRHIVSRTITCIRSGEVLDVDTCVVLVDGDGDPVIALSQSGFSALIETDPDALAKLGDRDLYLDPSTVEGRAWFVNEEGEPYDHPVATQAAAFPNDDHTPYATAEAAEAANPWGA